MPALTNAIMSAIVAAPLGLIGWKRKKETDAEGNPCLRYWGIRYFSLLCLSISIGIAIYHLNDPMYLQHPENFLVIVAFIVASLVSSILAFYRITLKDNTLERLQWPFKPSYYFLSELTFIGEKRNYKILHFSSVKTLKINILMSGQTHFMERIQTVLLSNKTKQLQSKSRNQRRHKK